VKRYFEHELTLFDSDKHVLALPLDKIVVENNWQNKVLPSQDSDEH
jgi:hypothetical protein